MTGSTNNNDNSSDSSHFIQHIIDRTIGRLSSLSSTKIANVIKPAITPDILPEYFQIPKQSRRVLGSNTMRFTSDQQDEENAINVYDDTTDTQQNYNNNPPKIMPYPVSPTPENKKIDDQLKDQKQINSIKNSSINNMKPHEKALQQPLPPPFFSYSSSPAIANKSNLQKKENDNNNNNNNYTNNTDNKTISSPQDQPNDEAIKESLPSPKTVKEQPPQKDHLIFRSIKNKSKDEQKEKLQPSSNKNQGNEKELSISAVKRIIKPLEHPQILDAAKSGKKERIPSAPDNNNDNKSSSLIPINQSQHSSSLTNQPKDTIYYEIKPTKPNIERRKAKIEPIVNISIGKIEVRASMPASKSPSISSTKLQSTPSSPILSLKDYLAQRAAGRI
jgi:hypothetical protein